MRRATTAFVFMLVLLSAFTSAAVVAPQTGAGPSLFAPVGEDATLTPEPTATSESQDEPQVATGEVWGRITNGTAGGEVPADLEVTLYAVEGQAVVLELNGEVEADGDFIFEDVELSDDRLFVVAAEHLGVLYFTTPASFPADQVELELPLTIYDTTQDADLISVEQLHIIMDFNSPGVVSILEVWVFSNAGDRTYAPDDSGLEIALPEGASALRFQDGGMGTVYLPTDDGFLDLEPVRPGPGSSQLLFVFDLPYERSLDFSQKMHYATLAVDVLIPEGGPSIREGDLVDGGVREVSSGAMRAYSTGPLAADETLAFRISGRIEGAEGEPEFTSLMGLVIGGALLGVVLIALGIWWYRSGSRKSTAGDAVQEGDLVQAIAKLDDEHAAGKISDTEYHNRREALKRRALDMMQEEND